MAESVPNDGSASFFWGEKKWFCLGLCTCFRRSFFPTQSIYNSGAVRDAERFTGHLSDQLRVHVSGKSLDVTDICLVPNVLHFSFKERKEFVGGGGVEVLMVQPEANPQGENWTIKPLKCCARCCQVSLTECKSLHCASFCRRVVFLCYLIKAWD